MLKLQLETSFYGCNPQTFRDYDLISISLKTILHTYLLITYLLALTSLANKAVTKVLNPCLCLASVWSMSKLHLFLVVFFLLAYLFCFPSDVLERAARVTFKYIILPSQFQRLLIKNLVKFSLCQILISDGIGQKYLSYRHRMECRLLRSLQHSTSNTNKNAAVIESFVLVVY